MNQATANAQMAALLALSLLAAALGIVLYRRQRNREQAQQQAATQAQLAALVGERTAQLSELNEQLMDEMDERQRAEARLHTMQDELVQASKLALLGQVAAGWRTRSISPLRQSAPTPTTPPNSCAATTWLPSMKTWAPSPR